MEKRNDIPQEKTIKHRHIWMELGDKDSDSYIQMCQDCGFHGDSCKCARCKCSHDWQPYSRTDKKWLWCDQCHSVKMRPEEKRFTPELNHSQLASQEAEDVYF